MSKVIRLRNCQVSDCAMRDLNFTVIARNFFPLKIPQLVSENFAVTNCTKQES